MAELDANGSIQALNTFGANGLVSRHTTATNASVFYTFDERGNLAQRLDSNGVVLSTDLYDAFGARTGTAPPSDPWGFGAQWGYQSDNETGLVLCTNRYYDPQQGRFLTRDPIGYAGGVNLYGYTANNPVNEDDADGSNPVPGHGPDGIRLPPGSKTAWHDVDQLHPDGHSDVDIPRNHNSPDGRIRGGRTEWRWYPNGDQWQEKADSINRRRNREEAEENKRKKDEQRDRDREARMDIFRHRWSPESCGGVYVYPVNPTLPNGSPMFEPLPPVFEPFPIFVPVP